MEGLITVVVKTKVRKERRSISCSVDPDGPVEQLYSRVSAYLEGEAIGPADPRLFFRGKELPRGGSTTVSESGIDGSPGQHLQLLLEATEQEAAPEEEPPLRPGMLVEVTE